VEQLPRGSWQRPLRDSLRQPVQGSSPRPALLAVLLLRVVQALPVAQQLLAVQALPVAELQVAREPQPALVEGL